MQPDEQRVFGGGHAETPFGGSIELDGEFQGPGRNPTNNLQTIAFIACLPSGSGRRMSDESVLGER